MRLSQSDRSRALKHSGYIYKKLNFLDQGHICKKVSSSIGLLKREGEFVDFDTLVNIEKALIQLHLDYGCAVWDGLDEGLAIKAQKQQNRTGRIITRFWILDVCQNWRSLCECGDN